MEGSVEGKSDRFSSLLGLWYRSDFPRSFSRSFFFRFSLRHNPSRIPSLSVRLPGWETVAVQ